MLAALFGTLVRHLPGGGTRLYPYDSTGPISTAWLARCRRELLFPEADAWWTVGSTHLVRFANGWLLATPALNDRAGWRWIEEAPLAALLPGPEPASVPAPERDMLPGVTAVADGGLPNDHWPDLLTPVDATREGATP